MTRINIQLSPFACQGRLTLESGVAVSSTDQTAKTTVYFTPYLGNRVTLYNGSSWRLYTFTEISLALGTLTSGKNYDVFLYDNSGTLTLELSAAWTNDTTRADALTTQDGVYVKSGSTTRLHLGTIRTTSTTTTEDSAGGSSSSVGGKRFVWNRYNRVVRNLVVIDTTNTWSYTTGTWRVANGGTAPTNSVEFVLGDVASDTAEAAVTGIAAINSNSARGAQVGVGVNSSSAPSGLVGLCYNPSATAISLPLLGSWRGQPRLGYNALSWLERGADGTCTFNGDGGASDNRQAGLYATIMG